MTDTVSDADCGAEDGADPAAEAAVARSLRDRAAAVQPAVPRTPAGVPDSGTGLRRLEARDAQAAARTRRATRRRQSGEPPPRTIRTGRSPARG